MTGSELCLPTHVPTAMFLWTIMRTFSPLFTMLSNSKQSQQIFQTDSTNIWTKCCPTHYTVYLPIKFCLQINEVLSYHILHCSKDNSRRNTLYNRFQKKFDKVFEVIIQVTTPCRKHPALSGIGRPYLCISLSHH